MYNYLGVWFYNCKMPGENDLNKNQQIFNNSLAKFDRTLPRLQIIIIINFLLKIMIIRETYILNMCTCFSCFLHSFANYEITYKLPATSLA